MAEPVAETRPVDEAAPVSEAIAEETSNTEVAGEVEAEAEENDDAAAPAEADLESEVDDDIKSKKVTLADLSAKGTALYAHKKYEGAADIFSRASILQAEINGETAPENAEILFHYGRSLFKVGQSKSDVLGGSAPAEKKTKANGGASSKKAAKQDEEKAATTTAAEGKENKGDEKSDVPEGKKLFFQFTGDENFDDESDEDEGQQEGDQDEEEDDDLATAFEILDLARVCYHKQLEKLREEEEAEGKGKEAAKEDSSAVRHIKERLAETHDCLAEISLENERYPNAIEDGRTSLNYKIDLYPEESEIIAEAHYKLSLALEFASLTVADDEGKNTKREEIDQTLRDEAVVEMEAAIKSFRLKMQTIEVEIASSASPEDNELSRKAVEEMKEVIADLEQRLVDLKKDPLSANDLLSEGVNPLGGLLGAALGGSAAEVQARVEEATKNAVDLSGLVRKKKPKDDEAATPANGGKRKADEESTELESKKAKVVDEQPAEAEK
ncbi:HAT1-interacting factor 1 [Trichoderma gamsii]|uniref:HAT1-interacting factor 1 n=1 Tax=Trichoderma gamsii TaxID=398673 RepID=A0A2P4ZP84_9HYPO|nr:HAT1-interacting factor 1 [Trichoderma gamsii]PON26103.1 HAT1-interacting factor 1 [Trichoderma gamsii]